MCFGLAFKANIDDLRESPAVEITKELSELYPDAVFGVEPNIEKLPETLSKKIQLISQEQALREADIILLLVDHKEFKAIEKNRLDRALVIDTKGIW
ncbi:UDP-N-acetyl-D-glucosamine 6-dehydrogenase [compost metagenome]